MAEMLCPVCSGVVRPHGRVTVLQRHVSSLQICDGCGYLFMPQPYWLDEAYSDAIASTDTGIVQRNQNVAQQLSVLLYLGLGERGDGCYLDVAGGYGILVRAMRDIGFDFRWSDKYAPNLLARGFELTRSQSNCTAVTAIEVLEHVTDPVGFLAQAMSSSGADTVVFSTVTYQGAPPSTSEWSYYSLETGQHVSFFQRRTLEKIASLLGGVYAGVGDMHVITRRAKPLPGWVLRLSFSRLRLPLFYFVKSRMASRIQSDHVTMVERIRQTNKGREE